MIVIRRWALGLGFATAALAVTAAGAVFALRPAAPLTHFADASNMTVVTEGKHLYLRACATCHGRKLQGQLLWEVRDQFLGQRAPAHDQTGHTWQHSDEELFHMTKFGRFSTTPLTVKSYMPAYGGHLSDHQILATIAYIKATWPLGLRVSQALLNPDYAGMPPHAETVEWRLPPSCLTALQRAGSAVGFTVNGVAMKRVQDAPSK